MVTGFTKELNVDKRVIDNLAVEPVRTAYECGLHTNTTDILW